MYSRSVEASKGGESDAKNRVQRPVSQDPAVGRGWGAGGFLESQDKFVGASAELNMASLPWVTWKQVLGCIVRLR